MLGAMSPAERESYERHLATCPSCRAEVTDLAGLPGLLSRLDLTSARAIADATDDEPIDLEGLLGSRPGPPHGVPVSSSASGLSSGPESPSGPGSPSAPGPSGAPGSSDAPGSSGPEESPGADPLLPRLLVRAKDERRRQRRRNTYRMTASTVLAASLAVLVVLGFRGGAINPPATINFTAMRQVVAVSPVTASVAVESYEGGTRVHVKCAYEDGPGDQRWQFRLVAIPKAGQGTQQELTNWTSGYGDEAVLTGHTLLKPQQIERIELRRSDGLPLLVYDLT